MRIKYEKYYNSTYKVENFCIDYTKDVQETYEVIHDENWDEADKKLDDLVKKLDRQKDFWLKVLDHQYYDDLNLELGLAKNAVYCKNKIRGLESLEKVESILYRDRFCTFCQ